MHKFKPHKGLKKRVTVTARKKIKREMSYGGHLMSSKSGRRRQKLRQKKMVGGQLLTNLLRALGEE